MLIRNGHLLLLLLLLLSYLITYYLHLEKGEVTVWLEGVPCGNNGQKVSLGEILELLEDLLDRKK